MSLEEETKHLEFASKTEGQTYIVDYIIIQLTIRGYGYNPKVQTANNMGNNDIKSKH
jgi:hypothetical protein